MLTPLSAMNSRFSIVNSQLNSAFTANFNANAHATTQANTQTDLEADFVDYAQIISEISALCDLISRQNTDFTFRTGHAWYTTQCKEKMALAKTHSHTWWDSILPKLDSGARAVIDYNDEYIYYRDMIKSYAEDLIKDPTNEFLAGKLIERIKSLQTGAIRNRDLVISAKSKLTEIIDNFKSDKVFYADLYTTAKTQSTADQQLVDDFTNDLSNLQAELAKHMKNAQSWQTAMIVLSVVTVVTFLSFVFMPVASVTFLGTMGSLGGFLYERGQIKEYTQKVIDKAIELSDAEIDLVACTAMFDAVTKINDSLAEALIALEKAGTLWDSLHVSMDELIAIINSSETHAKQMLYAKIIQDMEDSDKAWASVVEKAKWLDRLTIKKADNVFVLTPGA